MLKKFSKEYLDLLQGRFKGLNLTAIKDPEDFYIKQIEDSVIPSTRFRPYQDSLMKAQTVIDVGFGGGFPLLPLAYLYPEKQFIGLEARGKKADAVRIIAKELGLNNVLTFHARIEEILFDLDCVITFKAVAKIPELLPLINARAKIETIFYKGPGVDLLEDLREVEESWSLLDKSSYTLSNGDTRTLLLYKNRNVPCGTISNKRVRKISELIGER